MSGVLLLSCDTQIDPFLIRFVYKPLFGPPLTPSVSHPPSFSIQTSSVPHRDRSLMESLDTFLNPKMKVLYPSYRLKTRLLKNILLRPKTYFLLLSPPQSRSIFTLYVVNPPTFINEMPYNTTFIRKLVTVQMSQLETGFLVVIPTVFDGNWFLDEIKSVSLLPKCTTLE